MIRFINRLTIVFLFFKNTVLIVLYIKKERCRSRVKLQELVKSTNQSTIRSCIKRQKKYLQLVFHYRVGCRTQYMKIKYLGLSSDVKTRKSHGKQALVYRALASTIPKTENDGTSFVGLEFICRLASSKIRRGKE